MERVFHAVLMVFSAGVALFRAATKLLGSDCSCALNLDHFEENSDDGDRLGVYNYRTRRLDPGDDPIGWYDEI